MTVEVKQIVQKVQIRPGLPVVRVMGNTGLGGPPGPPGPKGDQGLPGDDAQNPNFTFGFNALPNGTASSMDVTGAYPNIQITLNIEKGPKGDPGQDGQGLIDGDKGDVLVENAGTAGEAWTVQSAAGTFRSVGRNNPTTGKGLEICYDVAGDIGLIFVYDRGLAQYKPFAVQASVISLREQGTDRVVIQNGIVAITGSATVGRSDGAGFAGTFSHTGGTVGRHGLKISTTGTGSSTDAFRVDTGAAAGVFVIHGDGQVLVSGVPVLDASDAGVANGLATLDANAKLPTSELPDAATLRAFLSLVQGIGFHCAGAPAANEVIGGMIAPYAFNVTAANCVMKALNAATAQTIITIKKNGAQIGTATFAAGATVGTFAFTGTAIAKGDQVTFHAPASADATLANIDGRINE